MISVDIEGVAEGSPLASNVSIVFAVEMQANRSYSCGYWDFTRRQWLRDGCILRQSRSSSSQVTCECAHLTNFAVLVDVASSSSASLSKTDVVALDYITYIGCGISIFGLAATLFTVLLFPVWR